MTIRIETPDRASRLRAALPRRRIRWFAAIVAAIAALALPAAPLAQPAPQDGPPASAVDQRWLPWIGCWQLLEEAGAAPEASTDLAAFADSVLVCVTPAAAPAPATDVVVTTLADGEQVLVETLSADGLEHAVDQTECRGRRRITWSDDGARLYTRAELTCSARDDARRLSGVGLMADGRTWLALEMVEAGERAAVTVRRYRRTGDVTTLSAAGPTLTADLLARARTAASRTGDADLSVNAVIEAAAALEAPVLKELLVQTETWFDLDGHTLIRLDEGGVPGNIIDILVALSFPDDFEVRRSARGGGSGGFPGSWGGYGYNTWYPYYAAPFGYYYGWSPYNSLYGWGDYYYLNPGYYGLPGSSITDAPDVSEGRIYEGYGYTRVATGGDSGGRRAQPRGTSGGGGFFGGGGSSGGSSSGSGGGSSGGGSVSAGGYTSSGGGRPVGTATPR